MIRQMDEKTKKRGRGYAGQSWGCRMYIQRLSKEVGVKDLTKALLVLDTGELGYDMQAP